MPAAFEHPQKADLSAAPALATSGRNQRCARGLAASGHDRNGGSSHACLERRTFVAIRAHDRGAGLIQCSITA